MLVKSGTGSFSMVGGMVMSAPQQHTARHKQHSPLSQLVRQLLRPFK
ncbi:MAG: hypothetical protein RLZZ54_1029 [Cyanobacteriota bacterium]|jgi:hypothetical protein